MSMYVYVFVLLCLFILGEMESKPKCLHYLSLFTNIKEKITSCDSKGFSRLYSQILQY